MKKITQLNNLTLFRLLLLAIALFSYSKVKAQILDPRCNGLNSLYQTIGSGGTTLIHKYNKQSREYTVFKNNLRGSIDKSGARASAYSSATRLVYIALEPTKSHNILNIYDPTNGAFSYEERIKLPTTTTINNFPRLSNNLFSISEPDGTTGYIGYRRRNQLVLARIDNIRSINPANITNTSDRTINASNLTVIDLTLDVNASVNNTAADYVYYNGLIYGMSQFGITDTTCTLVIIDPNAITGHIKTRELTIVPSQSFTPDERSGINSGFGATWIDAEGNFMCSNNRSGRVFRVLDVASGTIVEPILQSTPARINDGFGCEFLKNSTTPVVVLTDPNCSVDGTASIHAYIFDPLDTYSFTPDTGGISISASGLITGLDFGTDYKVNVDNGVAISSYSELFQISAMYLTPSLIVTDPAAVCSPATVDITNAAATVGSTVTYTYWTDSGATAAYATPNTATAGTYYIKGETIDGCFDIQPVTVTVNTATVGGTVSSDASVVCASTNSINLTLSGHTGMVVHWESSTDNFATLVTPIANTTTTLTASNLNTTTSYRAIVQSGACTQATSSVATITVDATTVGGTVLSDASTVCTGTNSTNLTLSGHTGTVIRWESSTDNFATLVTPIANTTTTLTASNLNTTTSYRAIVQRDVCAQATSSVATIMVNTATVGGTVSSDASVVCAGTNSINLTLSGHTGMVVRWESSTDNFATLVTPITNTTTTLTASNLNTITSYRAIVQNGACTQATSSVATITVDATTVGGTVLSDASAVCTGTNSTNLTLSGHTGTVIRWESSTDNFATLVTPIVNTTTTLTASNLNTTTSYRAVVQNGVCAQATSSVVTITVNALPVVTASSEVCVGSTITLFPTADGTWISSDAKIATITSVGVVTGVSAGTTTFIFTNTTTSCSVTTSSVTVNPIPPIPIFSLVTHPTCLVATGSFTISNYDAINNSYSYRGTTGPSILLTGDAVSGLSSDTYTVTTTLELCTSSASIPINPLSFKLPLLTSESSVCNENGSYTASFYSNGVVTASEGTIIGNTVTGLIGKDIVLTSTLGASCKSSSITVLSPTTCPSIKDCTIPTISVGQPVSEGTGTYSVGIGNPSNANIKINAGKITANAITGIPKGTDVTITAINGNCENIITVIGIEDNTPSCDNSLVSYSAGICNGSTYSINFSNPFGAIITASTGTVEASKITGITTGTAVMITATPIGGCPPQIITMESPACPNIAVIKLGIYEDDNKDEFVQIGEKISYQFQIKNTGEVALYNIFLEDEVAGVTITGGPIAFLDVGDTNSTTYTGSTRIAQPDIDLGNKWNQAEVTGQSSSGIKVSDLSDNKSFLENRPSIVDLPECLIEVFNAISSNADSLNEFFRIEGIECYPDNTVEIYNRWGVLVFKRDGYNNNDRFFKGFSEGRVTINKKEKLPGGVYYYTLKYKDRKSNIQDKAGYLYLNSTR